MHTVLIVDSSEDFRRDMTEALRKEYVVFSSGSGEDGLEALARKHPEGMILSLSLNDMDGIQFLERAGELRPKAIVTLSYIYPPYVLQMVKELGDGFPALRPCATAYIKHRLDDMLKKQQYMIPHDRQKITAKHLDILGYPNWRSYKMLCVGVPLFAQDPSQLMTKELYPAIAVLCDCDNWQQVESRIREGVHWAWDHRIDAEWKKYFPDISRCPTNKEFIERLAKILNAEESALVEI